MSAEVLRRAAALMREEANAVHRPFGRDERFKVAVADWLESEASYVERHVPSDVTTSQALAVSRAYLGEQS